MKPLYITAISAHTGAKPWQVENCIDLFAEGCTVPFISRYRKEKTGGLDDVAVASIRHWADVYDEMEKRKGTILATISEAGKLTPELQAAIENCLVSSELEDLYLPYRPKRKTRATVAAAKGLEPLADLLWTLKARDPLAAARPFVKGEVASVEDALAGARDIIAERIAETAPIREHQREAFRLRRIVSKATKAAGSSPDAAKYRSYFDWNYPLARVPSHNLLAVLRAENEGFLSVRIDADPERSAGKIYYDFCKEHGYPSTRELEGEIRSAIDDSFKRLIAPSIEGEVIREAKEKADIASIDVFGENLRQLLLAAPVGEKRVLAIDPGFRTGCKVVCLDAQGRLLHHSVIFPHPPVSKKIQAMTEVADLVEQYDIEVIAIGDGTAGRETEDFVRRIGLPESVRIFSVSEDGASVYSASDIGREEFPLEDVTVRGAVSIGRRLMDPLSELVKIDPKSLGIGQYQHDVDQGLLREKLDFTVEHCVNSVGVNLNTASPYLLRYVAGIGPSLAESIVRYRAENGPFASRQELLKVPRLGAKAFEQSAGFLRIRGAENPLDGSAVHPERYALVGRMASDLGVSVKELVGNESLCAKIEPARYVGGDVGLPTVTDILRELVKPGLDPRAAAEEFSFSEEIHEIEDVVVGMELPGIVTNITAFGAFVDIGIHEDGLIHVSQLGRKAPRASRGVTDATPDCHSTACPWNLSDLRLRQKVRVKVLSVDLDRRRIGLKLIS